MVIFSGVKRFWKLPIWPIWDIWTAIFSVMASQSEEWSKSRKVLRAKKNRQLWNITRPNCILCIVSGFRNKEAPFVLLLFFTFLWSFRQNFNMFKDLSLESRNIQTQNCAPIQCTVWLNLISDFIHWIRMLIFKFIFYRYAKSNKNINNALKK